MHFFNEIQQLNHSIYEPIIVPFDTDFVNSVNISQRIGEIDKWHHYFSPIMRYEKANVGIPNFDIVFAPIPLQLSFDYPHRPL